MKIMAFRPLWPHKRGQVRKKSQIFKNLFSLTQVGNKRKAVSMTAKLTGFSFVCIVSIITMSNRN